MDMEKLMNLCKQYGYIFQGSEIYGGLANSWDYGPLGIELKNNIKKEWWNNFIQGNPYNVGMDSAILMNSKVWEASGHLSGFNDPLIDCKECKTRYRADQLIEENVDELNNEELMNYIKDHNIKCPNCGNNNFTDIREFNLMFKTNQGVTEKKENTVYLRPETAQGIFVNFNNVQRSMRLKIPFGIGQIGKSFRNEITPGNFIFRTREFEQMELEFFCQPGTELKWFDFYKENCFNWLKSIGLKEENIKLRDHSKEELAHYSNATTDIEYKFLFGWGELWGIASRTDFDLKAHIDKSGEKLEYLDPETNEKYVPYVIEPSLGVDRLLLAVLSDAYREEQLEDGTSREVLQLHPKLAPFKATVLPLMKKYHEEKAKEIHNDLIQSYMIGYDETGSIGKRYRRQDVIGTPLCITIDDDSINNGTVTIRNRDTMKQDIIKIEEIKDYIDKKITI